MRPLIFPRRPASLLLLLLPTLPGAMRAGPSRRPAASDTAASTGTPGGAPAHASADSLARAASFNPSGLALVRPNIGGTYQDWHLDDRALPILEEAVRTVERPGEPFAQGWAFHVLGMLHLERRENDLARAAFDRSINHYAAGARERPSDAYMLGGP